MILSLTAEQKAFATDQAQGVFEGLISVTDFVFTCAGCGIHVSSMDDTAVIFLSDAPATLNDSHELFVVTNEC